MFDREILAELRAIRHELTRQTMVIAWGSGGAEQGAPFWQWLDAVTRDGGAAAHDAAAPAAATAGEQAWVRGLTPVTCPPPDLAALRPCLAGCQSHAPTCSAPVARNAATNP